MRTNYIGHERQYRLRREAGRPGWGTEQEITETKNALNAMLTSSKVSPPGKLLELGCGAGNNLFWLAAQGFEVYGVDIAPTAIAWARENAQAQGIPAQFCVGDVLTLADFADATFDCALDASCLHCIIGADRSKFLSNAYRVLKPGGVLFSLTMCNDPMTEGMKANFDYTSRYQIYGDVAIRYCGWPQDILREFRNAGFRILHSEVKSHPDGQGEDILHVSVTKEEAHC